MWRGVGPKAFFWSREGPPHSHLQGNNECIMIYYVAYERLPRSSNYTHQTNSADILRPIATQTHNILFKTHLLPYFSISEDVITGTRSIYNHFDSVVIIQIMVEVFFCCEMLQWYIQNQSDVVGSGWSWVCSR